MSVAHSFPLRAEEALDLGLIDGVKPRLDAMQNLMHYNYSLGAAPKQPTALSASQCISPVQDTTPESESATTACKGRQAALQEVVSRGWSDNVLQQLLVFARSDKFYGDTVYVTRAEPGDERAEMQSCRYMPLSRYIEMLKDERIPDQMEPAVAAVDDAVKPGIAVVRVTGRTGHYMIISYYLHGNSKFVDVELEVWLNSDHAIGCHLLYVKDLALYLLPNITKSLPC